MRPSLWPATYRINPGVNREKVIEAINGLRWDPDEWSSLQVAANLVDKRAETPKSYCDFLKRSEAEFWSPASVLFWQLIIVMHQFYQDHQPGPGGF
jgi:hypothetical protein